MFAASCETDSNLIVPMRAILGGVGQREAGAETMSL